jgi:hypothetical protein
MSDIEKLDERFRGNENIRPGRSVTWPVGKPFPWTDQECAAFCRGHQVKWPLSMDELIDELPGRVEMIKGYAQQWNA